jgi:hypothetical protein
MQTPVDGQLSSTPASRSCLIGTRIVSLTNHNFQKFCCGVASVGGHLGTETRRLQGGKKSRRGSQTKGIEEIQSNVSFLQLRSR